MSLYLSPELKAYYMADFDYLLKEERDLYWQLDAGIQEVLVAINENPGLQSLYSKLFQADKDGFIEPISYLRLAFIPELEKKVQNVYIELIQALDGREAQVTISLEDGMENRIFKADSPMGCKNNPEYFRIKHFYIELRSDQEEWHRQFWDLLDEKLAALMP
ncbi:MAG: hypothetical protein EP332_13450 [Bacteroidetes bacterium]|nr:MAG: hypothetical protein EP332_13450 [Bacteroidota bacterium]